MPGHRRAIAAATAAAAAGALAVFSAIAFADHLDVRIDSAPEGTVGTPRATFTFSHSGGEAPVSYTCRLDDEMAEPCTSPQEYAGLAVGSHVFLVTARDARGHVDQARTEWTVEEPPPIAVSIDSGPSGSTTARDASFSFSRTGGYGVATFHCRLDGVEERCSSPHAYTDLSIGDHVFRVRVTDPDGRTASAERQWSVTEPPSTQPPDPPASPGDDPNDPPPTDEPSPPPPAGEPSPPTPAAPEQIPPPVLDPEALAEEDSCPGPESGPASPVRGCTLAQLAAQPTVAVHPATDRAETLRAAVGVWRDLRRAAPQAGRLLRRGQRQLHVAAVTAQRAAPCAGAARARKAARTIGRAGRMVAGGARTLQRRAMNTPLRSEEETYTRERTWHVARMHGVDARRLGAAAREAAGDLRGLCRRTTGSKVKVARVSAVDDLQQTLRLSDGTTVAIGGVRAKGAIAEGAEVRVKGVGLRGGIVIAEVVLPVDRPKVTAFDRCLQLVVVPVQGPGGSVRHDLDGYLRDHRDPFILEEGMGLAAQDRGCPKTATDENSWLSYGLEIHATYPPDGSGPVSRLLAADLSDGDGPVPVPPVAPGKAGYLDVSVHRRVCRYLPPKPKDIQNKTRPVGCEAASVLSAKRYDITVMERGAAGTFEVAPAQTRLNAFGVGVSQIGKPGGKGVIAGGVPVQAYGYRLVDGGKSTYPHLYEMTEGDAFAVHPHTLPGSGLGLRSARFVGSRYGHPFWYTAEVPPVTTDKLADCFFDPGAFHRLPWAAGQKRSTGQGNGGEYTHNGWQWYAFDFNMKDGEVIHATRGGRVRWVVEHLTKTSNPSRVKKELEKWLPANALAIEHADGTVSWYFHMQPKGVLPKVGELVARGEPVAITGNTGNSSGPHLHFHVEPSFDAEMVSIDGVGSTGETTRAIFEAAEKTCAIPEKGEELTSTNAP